MKKQLRDNIAKMNAYDRYLRRSRREKQFYVVLTLALSITGTLYAIFYAATIIN